MFLFLFWVIDDINIVIFCCVLGACWIGACVCACVWMRAIKVLSICMWYVCGIRIKSDAYFDQLILFLSGKIRQNGWCIEDRDLRMRHDCRASFECDETVCKSRRSVSRYWSKWGWYFHHTWTYAPPIHLHFLNYKYTDHLHHYYLFSSYILFCSLFHDALQKRRKVVADLAGGNIQAFESLEQALAEAADR